MTGGDSASASSGAPPPSQAAKSGSWQSFLKSVASFNGDLSSLTAPPWILSTTSLTEFSAYWCEHPAVFVAPASESDPAKRALLVLKWFLTTLKQQYCSRSEKLGSEKKPLNPFLGELHLGKWEPADDSKVGVTKLVSEQVSHHPPVTAYAIWNDTHGVRLQGYNGQRASFSRTINVKQIGHALLHLDKFDEDYLITLPSLHIEGLYVGNPFIELDRVCHIVSSSGYTAKVDFSGRGWLSGKKNSFTASLYPTGKEKEVLFTADGQWSDTFTIHDSSSSSSSSSAASKLKPSTSSSKKSGGGDLETWQGKAQPTTPLTVAPISAQDELESRRAWEKVAAAIKKGDMETTSAEKTKIENSQRELRKKEKEEGREWERRYFSSKKDEGEYETFAKLAKLIAEPAEADKTGGMWVFDMGKVEKRPPFTE